MVVHVAHAVRASEARYNKASEEIEIAGYVKTCEGTIDKLLLSEYDHRLNAGLSIVIEPGEFHGTDMWTKVLAKLTAVYLEVGWVVEYVLSPNSRNPSVLRIRAK